VTPRRDIGVVADDLTGGCSIAGELATPDHPLTVIRWPGRGALTGFDGRVIIETGSRYIDVADARHRVASSVEALERAGFDVILKKIDSTLKGNVGHELDEFARSTRETVVVAPSCPSVGISVVGGVQHVDGVAGIDVALLLHDRMGQRPGFINLAIVGAGSEAVATEILRLTALPIGAQDAGEAAPHVVLADAETQGDLDTIAAGAFLAGVRRFAGTYGLGEALGRVLDAPDGDDPREAGRMLVAASGVERLLVLVGSANPASTGQIARAVSSGAEEIVVDVQALFDDDVAEESERVRSLVENSRSGVVIVHTDAAATGNRIRELGDSRTWTERDLAAAFAAPLAAAVGAARGAGIYFIGGETMGTVLDVLDWRRLMVVGEIDDAVPVFLPPSPDYPFVLCKPGAFGAEDALIKVGKLARAAF
jgi:uncharacterized protein YgbK (DUF1537 family)